MGELSDFENNDYETCRVIFESCRANYLDDFFKFRPCIERNKDNERLLESGFRMGWDALTTELKKKDCHD